MKNYVAPSLLSADKKNLKKEIKTIEKLGAEYCHWDIMDGIFVSNKNFNPQIVSKYSKCHKMINDVHIMVAKPLLESSKYIKAGADLITFHYEAVKDEKEINKIINICHKNKVKVGLSIKPKTKVKSIKNIAGKFDLILIMSVEPGKGGQKFIKNAVSKIKYLNKLRNKNCYKYLIEVDGGINDKTSKKCRKHGADILVAGSYLFGHKDIKQRIKSIR